MTLHHDADHTAERAIELANHFRVAIRANACCTAQSLNIATRILGAFVIDVCHDDISRMPEALQQITDKLAIAIRSGELTIRRPLQS